MTVSGVMDLQRVYDVPGTIVSLSGVFISLNLHGYPIRYVLVSPLFCKCGKRDTERIWNAAQLAPCPAGKWQNGNSNLGSLAPECVLGTAAEPWQLNDALLVQTFPRCHGAVSRPGPLHSLGAVPSSTFRTTSPRGSRPERSPCLPPGKRLNPSAPRAPSCDFH